MNNQNQCLHKEWDSTSSPGITFCKGKGCTVFKVHDASAAMRNAKHPHTPVYTTPIIFPDGRPKSKKEYDNDTSM